MGTMESCHGEGRGMPWERWRCTMGKAEVCHRDNGGMPRGRRRCAKTSQALAIRNRARLQALLPQAVPSLYELLIGIPNGKGHPHNPQSVSSYTLWVKCGQRSHFHFKLCLRTVVQPLSPMVTATVTGIAPLRL